MSDLPLFDPFKVLEEARAANRREAPEKLSQELSQKLSQPPAKVNREQDQQVTPTFAAFATFAESEPAQPLAPARVNTIICKNSSSSSRTYARAEAPAEACPVTALETPAKVAKVARVLPSHCFETEKPENGVAKVFEGDLRKWRDALAGLSPDVAPCPGFRPREWPRVLSRALDFLDEFGPQAVALGWTAPRLFGVHPSAGIVRVDACGALVLPITGAVRIITATEVRFGHLTHREKPGQPQGIPIWRFGR